MDDDIEEYGFKQLYEKYGPMVLRRCRGMLKNEEDAFDAMQDCFVKLLESVDLKKIKHPSSYLYMAATNICLNKIRGGAKSIDGAAILETIAAAEDDNERMMARELIESFFSRADVTLRETAVMYHVDEMTHEQIARATGLSVSGVRRRLSRFAAAVFNFRGEDES